MPAGLPVEESAAAGLVTVEGGRVVSAVHLQPWETGGAGGYVVSDRKVRPGDPALRPDHVVGAGGASANLAQLASRRPVGRALDLGTGCGVQVLHLDGRAEEITATDVNPRALELARLSWALSGITGVDARLGSLFDPVEDDRFDLVVSNPPFVISPAGRFTYRESGFHADDFCRDLVRRAPATSPPAAPVTCWPTGCTSTARTGATGWAAGSPGPAATAGRCSATSRIPPSTSSCG